MTRPFRGAPTSCLSWPIFGQDLNLEVTLRSEAPGILARHIALCPDVIANGLQAPKTVTDATAELLEENDVAKQFQEDMLVDTPGENVSFDAMESAVNIWLIGGASKGLAVRAYGPNRQAERIIAELKARYIYKRLRPEGNRNRKVYFFLNVRLREEET